MSKKDDLGSKIVKSLSIKANVKQEVNENSEQVFYQLKECLGEITGDFNKSLKDQKDRVSFEFMDLGKFISKLRVAGDMLVFSIHSNVFEFDREHKIWENEYVKNDVLNSYCGIINIYNFLDDSFRFNRTDDLGYLIARIFVNKDKCFFVEGKRQMGYNVAKFGEKELDRDVLKDIILKAINYALEFDLLVPPYDMVKMASVGQMEEKVHLSQMKTGKRLGFQFNSDDIDN